MAAFSAAISATVSPSSLVWSRAMPVTTDTSATTTLVASHRPPNPTSTTATSAALAVNIENAMAAVSSK